MLFLQGITPSGVTHDKHSHTGNNGKAISSYRDFVFRDRDILLYTETTEKETDDAVI